MGEIFFYPGCEPPADMEEFLNPNVDPRDWAPRDQVVLVGLPTVFQVQQALMANGFAKLVIPEREGVFMDRALFKGCVLNPIAGGFQRVYPDISQETVWSLGDARLPLVSFEPKLGADGIVMRTGFLRHAAERWYRSPQGDDFAPLSHWTAVAPRVLSGREIQRSWFAR